MYLTILLQAAESISSSLISRLGDQLFSIVLLVGYAFYASKKQMKLEDKLDKYMEEDHERMLAVIENNTKVMERLEDHLDRPRP